MSRPHQHTSIAPTRSAIPPPAWQPTDSLNQPTVAPIAPEVVINLESAVNGHQEHVTLVTLPMDTSLPADLATLGQHLGSLEERFCTHYARHEG